MRILFGVQGTGNGHIARSRTLARALANQGAEVDYLFSGRPKGTYFDMEAFCHYRTRHGLTFSCRDGRLSLLQTLLKCRPRVFWNELSALDCREYDLVVSDFEPLTAHAARRQGVPTLGISHQASFAWPVPRWGEGLAERLLMRHFAPVQRHIGLHWFHFGAPLLPPIVDPLEPLRERGRFLVYLPFEHPAAIHALLSRFSSHHFACFHPGVVQVQEWQNVVFYPPARQPFLDVLRSCRGVICNAGFELASEALSLGKMLLVKPLRGQFEQLSNGKTLALMGLATLMDELDPTVLRGWIDSEPPGRVTWPDVAQALAHWVLAGEEEPLSELSARLWRRTRFPEEVAERLCELEGAASWAPASWWLRSVVD